MNHLFMTIEGIEGAGKSTLIPFIKQELERAKHHVILTREPGGTEIAEEIRALLLNHHREHMTKDTELLLFFAARAQHIEQVIRPAILSGKTVLCDRFTDASYAYQCGGRGILEERIQVLEQWVQGDLRPDMTILLDIDPVIGFERLRGRAGAFDRFETEKIEFFTKVRNYYLQRAKQFPKQYRVIDASQAVKYVQNQLKALIKKELTL